MSKFAVSKWFGNLLRGSQITLTKMKNINYKRTQVMKMAWRFVKMYGMTMAKAMVIAWRNIKLRFKMGEGIVEFTYKKIDGSIRVAYGTLRENLVPTTMGSGRKANDTVQTYFDTEVGDWRCFKVANLLSVA